MRPDGIDVRLLGYGFGRDYLFPRGNKDLIQKNRLEVQMAITGQGTMGVLDILRV